jgi:hypothetical protein
MKIHLINAVLIFINIYLTSQFQPADLNKPEMFKDEICSYNGNPEIINGNVNCTCQPEFFTQKPATRHINGNDVQCNYEKKRRFIALFFSIFLPFGIDYLYLQNYGIFVLILFSCCFTLIGNCVRFAISSHVDYLKNKMNLTFFILSLLMVIGWAVNIVLVWTGIVKDGNGIDTHDDIYFLINVNNR